jgi:protoheme IX farnesyltransferase
MRRHIGILLELGKVRIAVVSVFSVFAGYVLAAGRVDWGVVPPVAGVFLLACAASALNQFQERDLDARMRRTRNRPIPSGRVTPQYVVIVSVILLVLGSAVLFPDWTAILLGWTTVFWYNGIYTPLKRISAFAAVPGGLVGALPPAIGWVCGGGQIFDPEIFAVSVFFFVWQIPHFWMLLMRLGKDYERAGLPTLTSVFTRRQLSRVTFVWTVSVAVSCLVFPFFGVAETPWVFGGLVVASVWLVWRATKMLRTGGVKLAFAEINA